MFGWLALVRGAGVLHRGAPLVLRTDFLSWRVGAQVWDPGVSRLRGFIHLSPAEGAVSPDAIPGWFHRSANKYLLAQQCSRAGWQLARASGIDGGQRGFPQDGCKDTLPLSDRVPALRRRAYCVLLSTLVWAEALPTPLTTACGAANKVRV